MRKYLYHGKDQMEEFFMTTPLCNSDDDDDDDDDDDATWFCLRQDLAQSKECSPEVLQLQNQISVDISLSFLILTSALTKAVVCIILSVG